MASIKKGTFTSGELAPALYARADLVKYQSGLKTCRNWFVRREGGVSNRAGFEFVCPLLGFGNGLTRLIPFVFNNAQAYVLVFQDDKLFFIRDGFPILESTTWNIDTVGAVSPLVITSTAHGLANDEMIYITDVTGTPQVNSRFFRVSNTAANSFRANEESTVDPSAYGAYQSGGIISRVYSIVSPYAAADLASLRFVQSADTLTITHPDYPPYNVTRVADDNWSIDAVTFEPTIGAPTGMAASGAAGADRVRYVVTAVAADTGEESFSGLGASVVVTLTLLGTSSPFQVTEAGHGRVTGDRVYFPDSAPSYVNDTTYVITVTGANTFNLDGTNDQTIAASTGGVAMFPATAAYTGAFPTSANPATVTWTAVAGALEYNVYREVNGIFAYVGTSAGTSFEDLGYTADPSDTPPIDFPVFATTGEYPAAVGYYQQRKLYGGPDNDPERIRASRTGLYDNFTKSNPIQDDDSISWVMASNQVNAVRHFIELERLFVFTQGAEWTIEGNDAGTLVPQAINPRKRSENGIGEVAPIVASNAILYVQYQGNVVNQLTPGQSYGAFDTRDLTVFSTHLFDGKEVVDWAYAKVPYSIVWSVRDDGTLLGLTYLREQEVAGWHRHDTGDGDEFTNVCCIPEGNNTATYAAVTRYDVNGQTRTYIERMADRLVLYLDQAKFLDSFRTFDSFTDINGTPANTYSLNEPSADTWTITAAGGLTFTTGPSSPDINRLIAFHLTDGQRVRVRITAITSTTVASVQILDIDQERADALTLPYLSDDWSEGEDTINGLWHAEGRSVMALADGAVAGPFTVTAGAVTLPDKSSVVHIGLAIEADAEPLDPDFAESETLADKYKSVSKATLLVERTRGLSVGADFDHLNVESNQKFVGSLSESLRTGRLVVQVAGKTSYDGTIALRQSLPLPCTVSGFVSTMTAGRS